MNQDQIEAAADIKENGAPLLFERETTGYDAEQSEAYSAGTDKFPTDACDWEYKLSDIDGTLIQQGDLRLIVACAEDMPDPEPGWTATYIEVSYRVESCGLFRKAGLPVCYDVQLRKA